MSGGGGGGGDSGGDCGGGGGPGDGGTGAVVDSATQPTPDPAPPTRHTAVHRPTPPQVHYAAPIKRDARTHKLRRQPTEGATRRRQGHRHRKAATRTVSGQRSYCGCAR